MIPLIEIPEIVKYYAPQFESIFSKSEYALFQKYIAGLIVSENKTVDAINRLFVIDVKDQCTLNRFLTASKYEVSSLNEQRLALMNQQAETKFKDGGVLGLDDTMLIHYGKNFDEIAYLFDHSTNTYVWAHNLVNLHYSDDQVDYPALFELWKPLDVAHLEEVLRSLNGSNVIKPTKEVLKKTAPKKWKQYLLYLSKKYKDQELVEQAYRSKLVIGKDLLRQFFEQYPDLDISVSFDKWFTCPEFCKFIDKELQKPYVAGLKSNEKILLRGSVKISVADFVKQLHEEQQHKIEKGMPKNELPFMKCTIKYKGKKEVYYNYCKTHHICGYGRQKILISHRKDDLSDTYRVFMGNRRHWRVQHMTKVGRHRWPVEEYHKEGKAEGLDQYQVRDFAAIEKHIALVALVYSLLQHARYDSALLNNLQTQLDTDIEGSLAYWRRTTQAQAMWMLVQWIDTALSQEMSLQEIMQTLLPCFNIS